MSLACGSGACLYQRAFRRTIIIFPLLDRSRKSAKRGRRARHSSDRVLMSPPWPYIAGPGIHQQGAYVASLSRLRVINTSWARICLYGTYVAMGWLAPNYIHPLLSVQFIPAACTARYLITLVGHTLLACTARYLDSACRAYALACVTRGYSLGCLRLLFAYVLINKRGAMTWHLPLRYLWHVIL